MFWGKNTTEARMPSSSLSASVEQYDDLIFSGDILRLPSDTVNSLKSKLLVSFKRTPFYSPAKNGRPLEILVSGTFENNYTEKPNMQTHSYNEKVPYQQMETVSYLENVPYTAYRSTYNYQLGTTYQEPYTAYRLETKYRQEMKTYYRNEPRFFNYQSISFQQEYLLIGKLEFILDDIQHQIPIKGQNNYNDTYHNANMPSIGLTPKQKKVPTALTWLEIEFTKVEQSFKELVDQGWDSKYCQVPSNLQTLSQFESVLKCLKGTRKKHDFVENWFKSQFGMSLQEVADTIGFELSHDDNDLLQEDGFDI